MEPGAGEEHFVVSKDGRLYMMGNYYNTSRKKNIPEVTIADNVRKLVPMQTGAGKDIFFIKNDDSLWCWINRGYDPGELTKIADGVRDACHVQINNDDGEMNFSLFIIKTDNSLWGYGNNSDGVLGIGKAAGSDITSPVKIMDNVKSVDAARVDDYGYTLSAYAVTLSGQLYGFGNNYYDRLGCDYLGTWADTPQKIMDNVSEVAFGGGQVSCITGDGTLYTFGPVSATRDAAFGFPTGYGKTNSRPVVLDKDVAYVAAAPYTTYWIKKDGTLWYTGMGGRWESDKLPVSEAPVKLMDNVLTVSATYGPSFALSSDGYLYGWGNDDKNMFNQGTGKGNNGGIGPVRIMKVTEAVLPPGPEGTIYRLFNPTNGDHIYTVSLEERNALIVSGWQQETSPGMTEGPDGVPVYRLKNNASGEHLFTADKNEKNTLAGIGWTVENSGEPVFYGTDSGNVVYRLYNPNAVSAIGSHHYTLDQNEIKELTTKHGWIMDNDGNPVFYLRKQ